MENLVQNHYHIIAIRQILGPQAITIVELRNDDDISVTLNVLAIQKNPVLMEALSSEDAARIEYHAGLVTKTPVTE